MTLFIELTFFFFSIDRRILLFPFGNANAPPNDTVSVYLDYAKPKKAPEGWHACAQFGYLKSRFANQVLRFVNQFAIRTILNFTLCSSRFGFRQFAFLIRQSLLLALNDSIVYQCTIAAHRWSSLRKTNNSAQDWNLVMEITSETRTQRKEETQAVWVCPRR